MMTTTLFHSQWNLSPSLNLRCQTLTRMKKKRFSLKHNSSLSPKHSLSFSKQQSHKRGPYKGNAKRTIRQHKKNWRDFGASGGKFITSLFKVPCKAHVATEQPGWAALLEPALTKTQVQLAVEKHIHELFPVSSVSLTLLILLFLTNFSDTQFWIWARSPRWLQVS